MGHPGAYLGHVDRADPGDELLMLGVRNLLRGVRLISGLKIPSEMVDVDRQPSTRRNSTILGESGSVLHHFCRAS